MSSIGAKDDRGTGDKWQLKRQTKLNTAFYRPDALGLAQPKLTLGLLTVSMTTEGSWLPREGCQEFHQPSEPELQNWNCKYYEKATEKLLTEVIPKTERSPMYKTLVTYQKAKSNRYGMENM